MKRALVLGLVLVILVLGSLPTLAWHEQYALCTSGTTAWPGVANYVADDNLGYPVYLYPSPTQSNFVTLLGYIEDADDPDSMHLFQPAGSTLSGGGMFSGEPKTMRWRGVEISITRCGLLYRFAVEQPEDNAGQILVLDRRLVPNQLPR